MVIKNKKDLLFKMLKQAEIYKQIDDLLSQYGDLEREIHNSDNLNCDTCGEEGGLALITTKQGKLRIKNYCDRHWARYKHSN